jgi:hypothetical protein
MIITLSDDEQRALTLCASRARREIRHQAAVIIRDELQRRGLLPSDVNAEELTSAGEVRHER